MTRINVYTRPDQHADPFDAEGPQLAGWFDYAKARHFPGETYWDGNNSACVHLRDGTRRQHLHRTARGRWVLENTSQWQNEQDTYEFITDDEAREWLIKNGDDGAVTEFFGEMEDESGPPVGGRPKIGPQVSVAYPPELLQRIDAKRGKQSRAEFLRALAEQHV